MRALALLCLAACGAESASGQPGSDANQATDAPQPCVITLTFNPAMPHSGATIRAAAAVTGQQGVISYAWDVRLSGASIATTPAAADSSQIDFFAAAAGDYLVAVDIGAGTACQGGSQNLNVLAPMSTATR